MVTNTGSSKDWLVAIVSADEHSRRRTPVDDAQQREVEADHFEEQDDETSAAMCAYEAACAYFDAGMTDRADECFLRAGRHDLCSHGKDWR